MSDENNTSLQIKKMIEGKADVPFKITKSDIDSEKDFYAEATASQGWTLNLVNMSNRCMELASIRPQNGNYGKWFVIPRTCKTCSSVSPDDCFKQKKWISILYSACTDSSFDIRVSTQPDEEGNGFGAEFTRIDPDCNFAGGVITLT